MAYRLDDVCICVLSQAWFVTALLEYQIDGLVQDRSNPSP